MSFWVGWSGWILSALRRTDFSATDPSSFVIERNHELASLDVRPTHVIPQHVPLSVGSLSRSTIQSGKKFFGICWTRVHILLCDYTHIAYLCLKAICST